MSNVLARNVSKIVDDQHPTHFKGAYRAAPRPPEDERDRWQAGKGPETQCRACRRRFRRRADDGHQTETADLCPDCRDAAALLPAELAPLPPFAIDRHPVTNRLFRIFHRVTKPDWTPLGWEHPLRSYRDQPVIGVSRRDCEAFCRWRSQLTGRSARLPSRAEWLRAALGDDGRRYPWGDDPPDYRRAAYSLFEDDDAFPAPVDQFPDGASPFRVLDMAGNAWEWTADDDADGPVYLGGSCGTEPRCLDPLDRIRRLLHPLAEDERTDALIGFRCVEEVIE